MKFTLNKNKKIPPPQMKNRMTFLRCFLIHLVFDLIDLEWIYLQSIKINVISMHEHLAPNQLIANLHYVAPAYVWLLHNLSHTKQPRTGVHHPDSNQRT
jgi:hypothetical protein